MDFIDREVDQRYFESRASLVLKALERERRRLIAARDAEILAERTTADDDFDALAANVTTFELIASRFAANSAATQLGMVHNLKSSVDAMALARRRCDTYPDVSGTVTPPSGRRP